MPKPYRFTADNGRYGSGIFRELPVIGMAM
jgi:hypothetical protein